MILRSDRLSSGSEALFGGIYHLSRDEHQDEAHGCAARGGMLTVGGILETWWNSQKYAPLFCVAERVNQPDCEVWWMTFDREGTWATSRGATEVKRACLVVAVGAMCALQIPAAQRKSEGNRVCSSFRYFCFLAWRISVGYVHVGSTSFLPSVGSGTTRKFL